MKIYLNPRCIKPRGACSTGWEWPWELQKTHVVHASGSRENPLTDDDLKKKFRSFVDGILSPNQTEQVIRLVDQFEEIEDAGILVKCLFQW